MQDRYNRTLCPAVKAGEHTGAFGEFAGALRANGYSPLPIIAGTKRPALRRWPDCCATPMTPEEIRACRARWPRAGVGIALGYDGLLGLDVDTGEPEQLAVIHAALPPSPVIKGGAKGFTAFYRQPAGAVIASRHFADSRRRGIVDLLSTGTQTVLPPSLHPAGHASGG